MAFSEFQRAYWNSCQSRKGENAETREEQPENSVALGQGPHSNSRDTHSSIFELFGRTKALTEWKLLTIWWSILHCRGHGFLIVTWHQMVPRLKECRPSTAPWPSSSTLPHDYKAPSKPPMLDTQFWRHYPILAPFAWQRNKAILFYFTQNSVSKIWFGIMHRAQAFGISAVRPSEIQAPLAFLLHPSVIKSWNL